MNGGNILFAGTIALLSAMPGWCQGLTYPIFGDVPSTAAYYHRVNLLRERLITTGCSANPQIYCPNNAADGVTPYYLTRGQAAVLIIRSLFSGLSGNPEGFTAPQTPYFSDVGVTHGQFDYIQKMMQLGITSGVEAASSVPSVESPTASCRCSSTGCCQKMLGGSENASVPPPAPCSSNIFTDVPSTHGFCAYIANVYNAVGSGAISADCSQSQGPNFCPDAVFDENDAWISGLRVRRGTTAFYLVKGVMDADNPQNLPSSGTELPAVSMPGDPPDCNFSGPAFWDGILLAGTQMYGVAGTTMMNFSDANFWTSSVHPSFSENNTPIGESYNTQLAVGGDGAQRISDLYTFDAAKNYRHTAQHQIATSCSGGSITKSTMPAPMVFVVNQQVLYRGVYQTFRFAEQTCN